jgi:uncharacterized protein
MRIGLISDTHGLLRPQALQALKGSQRILHAGDIGDPRILDALAAIAPVTAVRGNNDRGAWADALAETELLVLEGVQVLVIHDVKALADAHGAQVVIAGHSHHPKLERRDGVLFVNPGSAGPRRFKLPVCVGCLIVDNGRVEAELIPLTVS